jgi:hypothetical protein
VVAGPAPALTGLMRRELQEISRREPLRGKEWWEHLDKRFIHEEFFDLANVTENRDFLLGLHPTLVYHASQLWIAFEKHDLTQWQWHFASTPPRQRRRWEGDHQPGTRRPRKVGALPDRGRRPLPPNFCQGVGREDRARGCRLAVKEPERPPRSLLGRAAVSRRAARAPSSRRDSSSISCLA